MPTTDKLNVVCIGGGTGLSQLVRGLKNIENINLKCIVTVADNGGNSGVLKKELNIPAVGDIRNVLVALSNVPEQLDSLMNHRFDKGNLNGYNLGNLVLASLIETNDDFVSALETLSKVFNVSGEIIPSSVDVVDIKAIYSDKTETYGEQSIPTMHKQIQTIEYINEVRASKKAVSAILSADVIVYSIGSLYTSIIPNLIIPEIKIAIKNSNAYKIYVSNVMSQPGETDDYTLSEHLDAINDHLGFSGIDCVIADNKTKITKRVLDLYQSKGAYPIKLDEINISKDINIVNSKLINISDNRIVHDVNKIENIFKEELKCRFQKM